MSAESVAFDAQKKAEQALREIESHEEICAERYQGIHDSLGRVWKIFAWLGGTGFLLLMSVLGFLLKAQFDTITELSRATSARTELLDRQQQTPPQVVIQSAPGSPPITGATVEQQPQH